MYFQRLLNVARALRESPNPDRFTMNDWQHCGTPCCAIGHYAARADLQDLLQLDRSCGLERQGSGATVDASELFAHFGIGIKEWEELFAHDGCGNAQTAIRAAEYIEAFVARHQPAGLPDSVRAIFDMTPAQLGEALERVG
jgi:hypothetical protein